jgi:ATP-binding cassette, subfamily C, bacteriocin exporter
MKILDCKRIRRAFVRQHSHSDCGVACLVSLVNYFGGSTSFEFVREHSGTDIHGTTLLGLFQASSALGFDSTPLEAEGVDNLKEFDSPAILHVVIEGHRPHYMVFYGMTDGKFVLSDPAEGLIFYTKEEMDKIWEGKTLLAISPNEKFIKIKDNSIKKKQWLWSLIEDDLPVLIISVLLGIGITIFGLSIAVFSQKLIDDILPEQKVENLILGLILVGFLLIARAVLSFVRGIAIVNQSKGLNVRIIGKFYKSLLGLPKRFFDSRKTGEFIARLHDTRKIQHTVSVLIGEVLLDILIIVIAIFASFTYSLVIGYLMLGMIPFYIFLIYRFNKPIVASQRTVMKSYAFAESHFIDSLQGIGVIKSFNRENWFNQINHLIYGRFQENVYTLGILSKKFGLISQIMGVLFLISIISVASLLVLKGELEIGGLVAITGFAGMIIPAAGKLVMANVQIQEATVAFDRMYEFAGTIPENSTGTLNSITAIEKIELNSLSFRFPGRKRLLYDINLELKKGQMISILGESGGGKSSLLQILMRFYLEESGRIFINGKILIEEINVHNWRGNIGYVEQEIKVFNTSILENIILGNERDEKDRLINLCEEFGLLDFINSFPKGIHTIIGEEGIKLSGGQKQVLGIIRVLYHKPKVLFLDECTGAMDRNTENMILSLIQKLKKNMIVLMVTHRVKPALMSDFVYILENGSISSSGHPKELLKGKNLLAFKIP